MAVYEGSLDGGVRKQDDRTGLPSTDSLPIRAKGWVGQDRGRWCHVERG